jgi:hypothetical protein
MSEHQSVQLRSSRLRTDTPASSTTQDGVMLLCYVLHFSPYYFHPPCRTIRPLHCSRGLTSLMKMEESLNSS